MATAQVGTLLRQIQKLAAGPGACPWPDRQLLEDFAARRDQAAFTALVARHGPMVLRVCRRVLGHEQDAEDAFQATFLVLAGSSGMIRQRESLTGWLHGVAYRTAMKAKRSVARRRSHEARLRAMTPRPDSPRWDDVQAVLDEEIERLPDPYRAAFVLCVLEGKSGAEAAAAMGVKGGTVLSRVARARKLLQTRLARRGIKLTSLLAALAVAEGAGRAGVPAALAEATVRSGLWVAAGETAAGLIPPRAAALAAGVTRAMFLSKTKIALGIVLAVGLFAAGAGLLTRPAPAAQVPASPSAGAKPPAKEDAARPQPAAAERDKEDHILVSGRVVGPDGKPFAGAKVYVSRSTEKDRTEPAVRATSGADGRFRFEAARSEVDRGETVVAAADGCGPDWVELGELDKDGNLPPLRLVRDDVPITGRVLDLEAHPVRNATVRVIRVRKLPGEDLTPWVKDLQAGVRKSIFDVGKARKLLEYERLMKAVWGLRGVPDAVKTDAEGRFRLSGFGRERVVELAVEGPALEHRRVVVMTRGETPKGLPPFTYGAHFDHLAAAGKPLVGTVREKGTGRPAKEVQVSCVLISPSGALTDLVMTPGTQTTTDAQGRYRLPGVPKAKKYHLAAGGGPYIPSPQTVDDKGGLEAVTADFELERGAEVRGRLTDKATGRPVRGQVYYVARPENPRLKDFPGFAPVGVNSAAVEKDGSFSVAAVPGPGLLCARAQEDRFVRAEVEGLGAKLPEFLTLASFHAIIPVEPSEKDPRALTVAVALDPGKALSGTVLGPDGKPLDGVFAAGLSGAYSPANGSPPKPRLTGAAFTAVGLGRPRTLVFWHEEKKLARAVLVRGDERGPLTVRLEPLGSATGRLVDAEGRPQAGVKVQALYGGRQSQTLPGELSPALEGLIPPALPLGEATTDPHGRFQLRGLISGLKYDLVAVKVGAKVVKLVEEVGFPPGEAKDLGDVKQP
jgi:RNA polymerase sigma factor (sigma-70 family)